MYKHRIKSLEESHRALDKQINDMERTGNFKDEISRLTKLQWEHEHERVDFDDDR